MKEIHAVRLSEKRGIGGFQRGGGGGGGLLHAIEDELKRLANVRLTEQFLRESGFVAVRGAKVRRRRRQRRSTAGVVAQIKIGEDGLGADDDGGIVVARKAGDESLVERLAVDVIAEQRLDEGIVFREVDEQRQRRKEESVRRRRRGVSRVVVQQDGDEEADEELQMSMGFVARVVAEGDSLQKRHASYRRFILGRRRAGRVVALKERRKRREEVEVDAERQAKLVVADEQVE